MIRAGIMALCAAICMSVAGAAYAQEQPIVHVVEIEGEIRAGSAQFLTRSLERAQEEGSSLFVIQLDTPGGLLKATEDMTRLIMESDVDVAVFVHKSSGWAFSAGTYILMASDIAASHPSASIGAAQPREVTGGEADEKVIEASSVWMKSLAQETGRNEDIAEAFVRENLAMSGQEAHDAGVVDVLASDMQELLGALEMEDPDIREVTPNIFDVFLSFISLPYLVPLFLSLGTIGLLLVFRTGEVESIGLLGVVFLVLGLWGMGAIEISAMGVILTAFGILLLAIEIFFTPPDFGLLGIIGLVSLGIGVMTFAQEPLFPPFVTQAIFWASMGVFIAAILLMLLVARLTILAFKRPIQTGPESLIGLEVPVVRDIDPVGSVEVSGEVWPARSAGGDIHSGETVRIVKISGNTILVDKIHK